MVLHGIALHLMILHSPSCHCIVSYGVAGYCIVGFGAQAVSRKTPTYFILISLQRVFISLESERGSFRTKSLGLGRK